MQPGQPLRSAGQRSRQPVAAGGVLLTLLDPIRLGSLLEQLGDLRLKVGVGAVGPIGGVGGHLGAVQRDQPQAHHAGCRAQLERGHQQPGQGLLVAGPEAGDGHVIGGAVAGKDSEGEVLAAAPLDLPGGADAGAVGIQQHPQQHPGLVGGPPVPVGSVRGQERAQVQLVDHVEHEPGQMVGWQPVAQVGWEQERLVAVTGKEVVDHGPSYATACSATRFMRPLHTRFSKQAVTRQFDPCELPDATRSPRHPQP